MNKFLFSLLVLLLLPVAAVIIITPMDSQKQYIFGLISIGLLFILGRIKHRRISIVLVILSVLMSTRLSTIGRPKRCISIPPLKPFWDWACSWRTFMSGWY